MHVPTDDGPSVRAPGPAMNGTGKITVLVVVLGALVLSLTAMMAWLYSETRTSRDKSVSEMAQLKLSIELYGRQYTASATSLAELNATLRGLETRLAGLEESLAEMSTATREIPGVDQDAPPDSDELDVEVSIEQATLPEPASTPQPRATTGSADCVSRNSNFLVAAGDIFLVCGTNSWIAVSDVGAQRISFADGRSAYVGRSVPLDGTNCRVMVRSANAAWLAGFGELQINC